LLYGQPAASLRSPPAWRTKYPVTESSRSAILRNIPNNSHNRHNPFYPSHHNGCGVGGCSYIWRPYPGIDSHYYSTFWTSFHSPILEYLSMRSATSSSLLRAFSRFKDFSI